MRPARACLALALVLTAAVMVSAEEPNAVEGTSAPAPALGAPAPAPLDGVAVDTGAALLDFEDSMPTYCQGDWACILDLMKTYYCGPAFNTVVTAQNCKILVFLIEDYLKFKAAATTPAASG